jgi:hypothetical protein
MESADVPVSPSVISKHGHCYQGNRANFTASIEILKILKLNSK